MGPTQLSTVGPTQVDIPIQDRTEDGKRDHHVEGFVCERQVTCIRVGGSVPYTSSVNQSIGHYVDSNDGGPWIFARERNGEFGHDPPSATTDLEHILGRTGRS